METVVNGFIRTVNEFKLRPNKLLVDQGSEFYNNLSQKWLHDNDVLMYLSYNGGK